MRTYLAIGHLVEILVSHVDLEGIDSCFKIQREQKNAFKIKRTCLASKSISTVQSGNNQVGRVPSEFTAGASKLAWGRMRVKGASRESHVSAESERAGRGRRDGGWAEGG